MRLIETFSKLTPESKNVFFFKLCKHKEMDAIIDSIEQEMKMGEDSLLDQKEAELSDYIKGSRLAQEFDKWLQEQMYDLDALDDDDENDDEDDSFSFLSDFDEEEKEEDEEDEEDLLSESDSSDKADGYGPFSKDFEDFWNSEMSKHSENSDLVDYSDPSNLPKPTVTDLAGDKHELRVEMLPFLKNPQEELDKMLGCEHIRQQIAHLTALTRYNAQLKEMAPDVPPHKVSLHAIFQGAPGTGKTTLCKIYAALLHQAGALSRGHVVVANRATFIGTRWGDDETMVAETLNAARGGVLMIDEAYQLVSNNPNDPGRMTLQLMMPMLADEQNRDIAVVLCGYKGQMQRLLDLNEGLRSRFVNVFDFPEFSVSQLLEISRRRFGLHHYHFTRQAWAHYRDIIRKGYDQRDKKTWGNARVVANLLDEVYTRHAERITTHNITDRQQVFTITAADIKPVTLPVSTSAPKIGF